MNLLIPAPTTANSPGNSHRAAQQRILTLLSDFGLSDVYVGVMKGVIAQVNPDLTVIDLTHQIPPHEIGMARFALMTAFPYFPVGTVHVAVVDPGVGSQRRAVALALGTDPKYPVGFMVGPDNGLLSSVFNQIPILTAVELTNTQYWRTENPSRTFHGRDIFATVGAHLASGVPLSALGTDIDPTTLVQLKLPDCIESFGPDEEVLKISGCIQATDHFGNLITNIPATRISDRPWSVVIDGVIVPGQKTYSDRSSGELLALVGSHGWVEVAVNQGHAQAMLGLVLGEPVHVVIATEKPSSSNL